MKSNNSAIGNFSEFGIQFVEVPGSRRPAMGIRLSVIPPPPVTRDGFLTAIGCVYVLLCTVGLLGNAAVFGIIVHLLRRARGRVRAPQMFVYLLGLCVADALLLFTVPMLLVDMYLGHWPFGSTACRIHLTLESVTKLLSTFILMAVSTDRYSTVRRPHAGGGRSAASAVGVLAVFCGVTALLLSPLPYFANAVVAGRSDPFVLDNVTAFIFVRIKCQDNMPISLHKAFTVYTFVLGFCLPGAVICYCYWQLLSKICSHKRRLKTSKVPIRKLTTYTLLIVSFYFLCWSPYWLANLRWFYTTAETQTSWMSSNAFVYTMYIIHILPYANAAVNWVLYALMNSQLEDQSTRANNNNGVSSASNIDRDRVVLSTHGYQNNNVCQRSPTLRREQTIDSTPMMSVSFRRQRATPPQPPTPSRTLDGSESSGLLLGEVEDGAVTICTANI